MPGSWRELHERSRRLQLQCNTCAIVFNSGHLLGSKSGKDIDSSDCVVRFNDAPVGVKYQADVGNHTTVRFVGEQAVSRILRKTRQGETIIQNEGIVLMTVYASSLFSSFPHNDYYMTSKSFFYKLYLSELSQLDQQSVSVDQVNYSRYHKISGGFVGISTMLTFCPRITIYGISDPGFCERHPKDKTPYHYYDHLGSDGDTEKKRLECKIYRKMMNKVTRNTSSNAHVFEIEHSVYQRWKQTRNIIFRAPFWE